ncbi:MAG: type II toxin-antitoxin system RelE/ParE family toxin [SAR324 cluster bacterium]|nr:type II toxin-antitoxin system RelE/ParE family toxin [SAR324 cluster bacterium]
MIKYRVLLSEEAEKDLKDISVYVARYDSPEKAILLLENLEETCVKLESYPNRGHVPTELERFAMDQYLEIYFKPYRIIYEIGKNEVFVHCIIDGRRDIESILRQRLLRI